MTVPASSSPCWLRLASGEVPAFQTTHIALKFLLKKLRGDNAPAPSKVKELHEFFVKYERLLDSEIRLLNNIK
jgi:hypothetical protein